MDYGITDLSAFIIGTILIVLLPGPNSLYVMTVASRHGIRAGYLGACGIFLGDTVLMVLAVSGAASLLKATPWLFDALKYAGAGYLAWLGWGLLRAAWQRWRSPAPPVASQDAPEPAEAARHPLRVALTISLLNPKAILFFVSFFIQFVSPQAPNPALSFVLLGIIVQLCSAIYLSLLIFAGARLAAAVRRRRRLSALATGSVGGLFIGFGAKLAAGSLL